jgi:site-specific DNA recombinase
MNLFDHSASLTLRSAGETHGEVQPSLTSPSERAEPAAAKHSDLPAGQPIQFPTSPADASAAQPPHKTEVSRPKRSKPRLNRKERGLPTDPDLQKLATVYLTQQHAHWPQLPPSVLPTLTPASIEQLVDDFKRRHIGERKVSNLRKLSGMPAALAASYLRYSCDNSNPRSLDDQLTKTLNKAHQGKAFVPWDLVYADASITGIDPSRQGYCSLKDALADPGCRPMAVIIDEFSRAGRDTLEWFRLSFLCRKHDIDVLGASDGFQLKSQMGEMMLHVFGMFSRFFLSQLREKVRRGMEGAARRQTSRGRPALGMGLAPKLDGPGRAILGKNGRPLMERQIHWETAAHLLRAAEAYAEKRMTLGQIAKEWNRLKLDGSEGWTTCSVRRVITNPIYIGQDIYNRTRNERDPETGKRMTFENPKDQWIVQEVPHLRLFSDELWEKIQSRLHEAQKGPYNRSNRNADSPTTLLSGILECQCGQDLKLLRSGRHAVFGCLHGQAGLCGCTMNTAKAAVIIEEAVLDYVRQSLLSEEAVERLVRESNTFLHQESSRPKVETVSLKAEIEKLKGRQKRLIHALAGEDGDDEDLLPIKRKIKTLQRTIRERNEALQNLQQRNQAPPPPLDAPSVLQYLQALRGLLNEQPVGGALVLRKVLGRIKVSHERYTHRRKGGCLLLRFKPRLLPALKEQSSHQHGGDAVTLEYLNRQMPEATGGEVRLIVDQRPSEHQRLAPLVAMLKKARNSATGRRYTTKEIAEKLGCSIHVVPLAWKAARSNPMWLKGSDGQHPHEGEQTSPT